MGFVWCFTLKWPHTIQSLFLRRCLLYEATHVGIFLKRTEKEAPAANKTPGGCFGVYDFLSLLFARASECIQIFMSLLFSDSDCYHCQPNGTYQICPVQREADYSRFLVLLFRRYNFDDESSMFVSGKYPVGETIGDLQAVGNNETGLAATDVEQRLRFVGPNSIEMPKPVVWNVILHEFCKPFYTYQLFMIFSCTCCSRPTFICSETFLTLCHFYCAVAGFPLYYYYMALVWSGVVTMSGLTVAYFQYRNLATLHRITLLHGQSTVLRDGEWVELDQKKLVPGDSVKIQPGIAFCDMVLVCGGATLVDESALTGEATPQGKTPINRFEPEVAKSAYSATDHKRQTITAGTTVLETDDSIGVVVQTGSYTAKGELIRDIFSFRRHNFKFDSEVYIVMGILVLYAIVAFNIAVVFIEDAAVFGWFYGM
jgi:E1-E2 ATPase/Cation transporter/ATPase, N-terminus